MLFEDKFKFSCVAVSRPSLLEEKANKLNKQAAEEADDPTRKSFVKRSLVNTKLCKKFTYTKLCKKVHLHKGNARNEGGHKRTLFSQGTSPKGLRTKQRTPPAPTVQDWKKLLKIS